MSAGETHVAREHELVTDAARAAANLGDAYDWRGAEAHYKIVPKTQHLRTFCCLGYVEMSDEKLWIRRLEQYDLCRRVRLEVGQQCSQFEDRSWYKHVDRRIA